MNEQLKELLYQMLETELGGVQVYTTALECAVNDDLEEEWTKYLAQTKRHVEVMLQLLTTLGLDPEGETPGRQVVRHIGESLVQAMQMALASGDKPEAAELVACECVVAAETKDHLNWELIGKCSEALSGAEKNVITDAYDQVEDQEDEHVYHSKGWCRELWMESLGLTAILPPPEETQHVKTAVDAA